MKRENNNYNTMGGVSYRENSYPVNDLVSQVSNAAAKEIKKGTKIILPNNEEFEAPETLSMDELLDSIKEDPAYSNITEDNVTMDENGNVKVTNPKVRVNGAELSSEKMISLIKTYLNNKH